MKFEYEIKGIVLDEYDMQSIHEYYEQRCTAEFLVENYDINEKLAMELAYLVRRKMDKYGYTEEDAIYEVLDEAEIDQDDDRKMTPAQKAQLRYLRDKYDACGLDDEEMWELAELEALARLED